MFSNAMGRTAGGEKRTTYTPRGRRIFYMFRAVDFFVPVLTVQGSHFSCGGAYICARFYFRCLFLLLALDPVLVLVLPVQASVL